MHLVAVGRNLLQDQAQGEAASTMILFRVKGARQDGQRVTGNPQQPRSIATKLKEDSRSPDPALTKWLIKKESRDTVCHTIPNWKLKALPPILLLNPPQVPIMLTWSSTFLIFGSY